MRRIGDVTSLLDYLCLLNVLLSESGHIPSLLACLCMSVSELPPRFCVSSSGADAAAADQSGEITRQ